LGFHGSLLAGLVAAFARAVFPVAAAVAVEAVAVAAFALRAVALRTVITRAVALLLTVIAGTIITRTIIALAIVAGTVVLLAVAGFVAVARLAIIALALVVPLALVVALAFRAFAALVRGLLFAAAVVFRRLGLEVDVEAGGILVAAEDLRDRPVRLHGAKGAEVVFGVLQVVLREHPVAGRRRVAGELLVALEDGLGGAADLHIVRSVRLERAIGVVLGLAPAATAAIAAALTLHTLEISHICSCLFAWPGAPCCAAVSWL
jgi:hypothetical protein